MTKLPSDAELRKFFSLGRTDKDIAEEYGVTVQAVNLRFVKMGLERRPVVNEVRRIIKDVLDVSPDDGPGAHYKAGPAMSLKAWLRWRLGDAQLGPRQVHMAQTFENRLRRKNQVLEYDRTGGWKFVSRVPEDEDLVIRWPEDKPWPMGKQKDLWELPQEAHFD